eukprot:TRINITY_DN11427_c0_g1_i1.p2 TRINITY_DN11427_c0_g1~~TRINITY_DN11427_c0_g1_i1.p2  ORF type:complete len:152 (+),score=2.04 TRINITY_DN11427_c0_g1_i1:103-558(+)
MEQRSGLCPSGLLPHPHSCSLPWYVPFLRPYAVVRHCYRPYETAASGISCDKSSGLKYYCRSSFDEGQDEDGIDTELYSSIILDALKLGARHRLGGLYIVEALHVGYSMFISSSFLKERGCVCVTRLMSCQDQVTSRHMHRHGCDPIRSPV